MLGSQGTGRQGLHKADDGGGAELQGEAAVKGDLSRAHEEPIKGVTGGAPPKTEQCDKRGVRAGGRRGRKGQQSQDI